MNKPAAPAGQAGDPAALDLLVVDPLQCAATGLPAPELCRLEAAPRPAAVPSCSGRAAAFGLLPHVAEAAHRPNPVVTGSRASDVGVSDASPSASHGDRPTDRERPPVGRSALLPGATQGVPLPALPFGAVRESNSMGEHQEAGQQLQSLQRPASGRAHSSSAANGRRQAEQGTPQREEAQLPDPHLASPRQCRRRDALVAEGRTARAAGECKWITSI